MKTPTGNGRLCNGRAYAHSYPPPLSHHPLLCWVSSRTRTPSGHCGAALHTLQRHAVTFALIWQHSVASVSIGILFVNIILHHLPPPFSHMCVCVCVCSVSGLVCLQIVFTVDRATQNRTQPKGNKRNAPTLLLRFYTANKHTSHTHPHTHAYKYVHNVWGKVLWGGGGGVVERARLCIVFMCWKNQLTHLFSQIQMSELMSRRCRSRSVSLCLALSRIVSLCLPLLLLHSFFNICISSCFLSLSLSPLSLSPVQLAFIIFG